jgi:hypothetical protein
VCGNHRHNPEMWLARTAEPNTTELAKIESFFQDSIGEADPKKKTREDLAYTPTLNNTNTVTAAARQ